MICSKCGANNNDGASSCSQCGMILKNNQPPQLVNEVPVQNEINNGFQQQSNQQNIYNSQLQNNYNQPSDHQDIDKSNNKKLLLCVIAIIIFIIGVLIIKIIIGKGNNSKKIESLYSFDRPIRVKKNNKYGYIDSNGKFIIQPHFEYAGEFLGDYALVTIETTVNDAKTKKYQLIDKKGKVKMTSAYSTDIKYIEEYDVWIIKDQLYNNSLKKISSDGIEVDYESDGYLSWENKSARTGGIMTTSGKVTYTYKFLNDEDYLGVDPSKVDKTLNEQYCKVTIDNEKYGIVNCNTGKLVYNYTDKYISAADDNIFVISNKEDYKTLSTMYIQNDKVIYESSNNSVELYYNEHGYVKIIDHDKEYDERYSYIDTSTGKISKEEPSSSNNSNSNLDEWEEYTKMKKFSCSSGYGIMKGNNIKIPCEWSSIEYFDLSLYKYLSSKGKEYVMTEKNNKKYLLNLKDGKTVAEFNTKYIHTESESTFIFYQDNKTQKSIVYNLITGKSLTVKKDTGLYIYSNYINLKEGSKLDYYNMNLELIYTEK